MLSHQVTLLRMARGVFLLLLASGIHSTLVQAQVPAEQAADLVINAARKAQNDGNYPFAITKYQEYIQKYANQPQVNAARYGLAVCMIDGPDRNYEKAIEPLNQLVGNTALPEHPYAVYYMGIAQRGQALSELSQAAAKQGGEQQKHLVQAENKLREAAKHFATAVTAFTARLPKEMAKDLPKELDWAARARCDQAEMELRLNKPKEAKVTAEAFTKDPLLAKSRYLPLGLYYHGFAAFQLQDYLVAGRSLNQLAPFADPINGLHARYLMGRIYQITEENDKALAMYDQVGTDFEKQKKEAIEALKRPDLFKNNPAEKARLEALAKTFPEHVTGSIFFSASLLYEAGKFGEALTRFQTFAKDNPNSPFLPDAALRIGFCQVQLKQFAEAAATLAPLVEKNPKLADQILFWLGKAQTGQALAIANDAMNAAAREAALKTAITTLRTASDRAAQFAATDPDAKIRRGEILLELGDVHQHAQKYKEAVALYDQILAEKILPARIEETTQRLIAALHLAGDFARSDQVATTFQKDFPRSPLLPLILFRMAENAYFTALAAEKRTDMANKAAELAKMFEETAKRYKLILERYPEFERVHLARYGLAMCHLKRNEFEEARVILENIPLAERVGDLSLAPYLLAECLIRSAPPKAEDALQVGMLQEKLQLAVQNLDGFIGANPKGPEVADAMLKLGVCQTRLGVLIAVPQERNTALNVAKLTFEKLAQAFPKEPQGAQAVMERAKCIAFMGDKNGAINELRKFTQDPLQQTSAAPVAVLQLATLLREQNKAEEGANILSAARQRHDPVLTKEQPERAALLRFHHGICLQEAGKPTEARALLDSIPTLVPGKPLAVEAVLRGGQCRLAEIRKSIETGRKELAKPKLNPEQLNAANGLVTNGINALSETAQSMQTKGEEFREKLPDHEARARLFYEAAWTWRQLAEQEVAVARGKLQLEKQKQLQAEADKNAAPGTKAPPVPLPEIARALVPLQPSETKSRNAYGILISSFADTLLAIEARFELAEMQSEREEYDPAIKLLKDALDKEPNDNKIPSNELLDRIRIRLGACLSAKKMHREALEKLLVVADNPKSPLVAQGQYRAGECLLELGETDKAIARFLVFRDKPEFQNIQGLSDRAFLRLGQAYAAMKQWEPSQQAMLLLQQRAPNSPWVHEARFGQGWALQNAGNYDPAVVAYNAVIANTTSELAARAHIQIGLCRLEQKRYAEAATSLLVVPYTFDFPELNAAALAEAARALIEDKKPEQAERLLRRVIKDHPQSEWAKVAQKRLDELKK
ncbi:MAG: tetratricopeptide repeat protein [Planctomycetes bacterium]|nr:tetratricopeptide repeat protein [Planctomycetota bacterium]